MEKQKQLPPLRGGGPEERSPRVNRKGRKNSDRADDSSPESPRNETMGRSKYDKYDRRDRRSPDRAQYVEKRNRANKDYSERISPRKSHDRSDRLHAEPSDMRSPRDRAHSPLLNRRDKEGHFGTKTGSKIPPKEEPLLPRSRKERDMQMLSPRRRSQDDDGTGYEEFRTLAIGSPIPDAALAEGDTPQISPRKKTSPRNKVVQETKCNNNKNAPKESFPSITVQRSEEDGGYNNLSPRQKDTPTISCKGAPSKGKNSHKQIDINESPFDFDAPSKIGKSRSHNNLLNPHTPPMHKKAGNKQFVVYQSDGKNKRNARSYDNLHGGDDNERDQSDEDSEDDQYHDAKDSQISPRSDGVLTPRKSRFSHHNPSPLGSPYQQRKGNRPPGKLEPIDPAHRRSHTE